MVRGLMLIKAPAAQALKIAEEARKIEGVTDAYGVFGRFDAVVFIEGKSFHDLKDVARKVASLEGVKSTETLPQGD
ncbi:MAG: Lrp/AsnC ligand binding domain-containing protein [Candidatus Geothermarchaeales archaeon]